MTDPARAPLRLHMRQRAGMYVGGLNPHGLRTLLDGIVTEQLEAPGARPQRVRCTIGADGTHTVELSGGAPAAVVPEDFLTDTYDPFPPDRFLSLAVASAFSAPLDAEVVRDGRRWSRSYSAGLASGPLESGPADAPPLVRIRYRPDPALFPAETHAGFLALCGRAQEWAAFHPHARFTLEDERDHQRRDFHYPDGLRSLAQELDHQWLGWDPLYSTWHCRVTSADGTSAEAVFSWRPGAGVVHSFVNGRRTPDAGTHVQALRRGVADIRASPDDDPTPSPFDPARDPLHGMTVLLAVRVENPCWEGSLSFDLADPRAAAVVNQLLPHFKAELARRHDGEAPRTTEG